MILSDRALAANASFAGGLACLSSRTTKHSHARTQATFDHEERMRQRMLFIPAQRDPLAEKERCWRNVDGVRRLQVLRQWLHHVTPIDRQGEQKHKK